MAVAYAKVVDLLVDAIKELNTRDEGAAHAADDALAEHRASGEGSSSSVASTVLPTVRTDFYVTVQYGLSVAHTVLCRADDTVATVKHAFVKFHRIPFADNLSLYSGTTKLRNNTSLESCFVKNGDTLILQ